MKIERGIPMPERIDRADCPLGALMREMQIGDSILLDYEIVSAQARSIARGIGIRIIQRLHEGRTRIWRLN